MQTIRGLGRTPGHMLLGLALLLLVIAALCGGPAVVADDEMDDDGFTIPDGDAVEGREAFIRFGCHECHLVVHDPDPEPSTDRPDVETGPELRPSSAESLVLAIVAGTHGPATDQPTQTRWPPAMSDLGTRMTLSDLINIVEYLEGVPEGGRTAASKGHPVTPIREPEDPRGDL